MIMPHILLRSFHLKTMKSIVLTGGMDGKKKGKSHKEGKKKTNKKSLPLHTNSVIYIYIYGNERNKQKCIDLMDLYSPYFEL